MELLHAAKARLASYTPRHRILSVGATSGASGAAGVAYGDLGH